MSENKKTFISSCCRQEVMNELDLLYSNEGFLFVKLRA